MSTKLFCYILLQIEESCGKHTQLSPIPEVEEAIGGDGDNE